MRDLPFSYRCSGCGRCCFEKRIVVSPYEIARIAEVLAISTTEVIARYTVDGGTALRQRDDGGCSLLDGAGCSVHAGRPLVCRLYPLGRAVDRRGAERFVVLQGHPESEGTFGTDGTVEGFLASQGTEPYIEASRRYFALFQRLLGLLRATPDGNDTFADVVTHGVREDDLLGWLDIDATLDARAQHRPDDLDARVALHLSLLEAELAT